MGIRFINFILPFSLILPHSIPIHSPPFFSAIHCPVEKKLFPAGKSPAQNPVPPGWQNHGGRKPGWVLLLLYLFFFRSFSRRLWYNSRTSLLCNNAALSG